MGSKIIYHVDVNSAFLSWTAAYQVNVLGKSFDLRTVPSVIAGDRESRRSIILAKSMPAKKYGVKTGEPLFEAARKCPNLIVEQPDYSLYVEASRKFVALLREVSPAVEQYSIDEAFADMTGTEALNGPPVAAAEKLKNRIRDELGFTVNIGISSNKLLAKMAGDFQKPDLVHTLFPDELGEKLWPLPVRELFFVGPATEQKLHHYGINTIGDIAKTDPAFLRARLHKHGEVIWNYANGRTDDAVTEAVLLNKGYGNSTTTPKDVTDAATAHRVLLSLCETVCTRMRADNQMGCVLKVQLRSSSFATWSHQTQLPSYTDVTSEVYREACRVFDEMWDKRTPLRQLGVHLGKVTREGYRQYNLYDGTRYDRLEKLDRTVDSIRAKFGEEAIYRACFLNDAFSPMGGGLHPERRTGLTKPISPM